MNRTVLDITWSNSVRCLVLLLFMAALFVCQSCKGSQEPGDLDTVQQDIEKDTPSAGAAMKATQKQISDIDSAKTTIVSDVGFKTPESVYYDATRDVYLVSNINGSPLKKDNNGFISKLSPDGKMIERRWIAGNQNGVTLHAPKGMAISDGLLHVTDIDVIRIFDLATGRIKGKIAIPNAAFLNDLSSTPDNTLYVSDTGWKAGPEGFVSAGSDSVWRIRNGNAKKLTVNKNIPSPNGLLALRGAVLVVNAAGDLYQINDDGAFRRLASLSGKGLDGIVQGRDGQLFISSWETRAIYEGNVKDGFKDGFKPVVTDITSPADIGYDTKRQRLLVPVFQQDEVRIIPVTDK